MRKYTIEFKPSATDTDIANVTTAVRTVQHRQWKADNGHRFVIVSVNSASDEAALVDVCLRDHNVLDFVGH